MTHSTWYGEHIHLLRIIEANVLNYVNVSFLFLNYNDESELKNKLGLYYKVPKIKSTPIILGFNKNELVFNNEGFFNDEEIKSFLQKL